MEWDRRMLITDFKERYMVCMSAAVLLSACIHNSIPAGSTYSQVPSLLESLNSNSSEYVMVVAHRACWQEAPENSIEAIEECISAGVDMVELDVRRTSDGVLILMHDETFDRTTTGQGDVEEMTYNEVKKLRLRLNEGGTKFGADPRQLSVPTLRDSLLSAKDKILVNIDAKANLYDEIFEVVDATGTGDQVLMKMRAAPSDPKLKNALFHGRALFMPVIVQCSVAQNDTRYCANELKLVYDDYLNFDPVAFEIVFREKEFLWDAIPEMKTDGRIWVNTLHPEISAGMSNAAAMADPEGVWGQLVDRGVNMIQTDNPKDLIAFLEQTNRRGYLNP